MLERRLLWPTTPPRLAFDGERAQRGGLGVHRSDSSRSWRSVERRPAPPAITGPPVHRTCGTRSPIRRCGALEVARDATLRFLTRPFWAWLGVLHILLIIGDGAFFFFLLVNWQAMCVPDSSGKCEPRNWWYNLSIQVLNALFTYGVALTMAWRLANAHHLCCSRRSCAPGRDLYGRPTDAIWFSLPVGHRRAIVALLLGNTVGQFANQATRVVYSDFASDGFRATCGPTSSSRRTCSAPSPPPSTRRCRRAGCAAPTRSGSHRARSRSSRPPYVLGLAPFG